MCHFYCVKLVPWYIPDVRFIYSCQCSMISVLLCHLDVIGFKLMFPWCILLLLVIIMYHWFIVDVLMLSSVVTFNAFSHTN